MDAILKTEDIKREATSLKINPDLWKVAKIEAINHNITLSALVEEAIKEWITKRKEQKTVDSDGDAIKIASKYTKR